MRLRIVSLLSSILGAVLSFGGEAQPGDFAYWLEQIPDSPSVLVNASWAIDGVQGFSFGVCHNLAETTLGVCGSNTYDLCRDDGIANCPAVECTPHIANSPCDGPPGFVAVAVYEDGVSMAVALMCMQVNTFPATDRIELLKITYTPRAARATLEFCDGVLGSPPVPNCVIHDGRSIAPAGHDGIVLDFGHAFRRGDANASGAVDIADAIFLLYYLFAYGPVPDCREAGDANDDGAVDIADAIAILSHLFVTVGPLKPPFGECGFDPTADTLGCARFSPCQ